MRKGDFENAYIGQLLDIMLENTKDQNVRLTSPVEFSLGYLLRKTLHF